MHRIFYSLSLSWLLSSFSLFSHIWQLRVRLSTCNTENVIQKMQKKWRKRSQSSALNWTKRFLQSCFIKFSLFSVDLLVLLLWQGKILYTEVVCMSCCYRQREKMKIEAIWILFREKISRNVYFSEIIQKEIYSTCLWIFDECDNNRSTVKR